MRDYLNEFRTSDDPPNELLHYGVKGMKWGVRRDLRDAGGAQARSDYAEKKDRDWAAGVNTRAKISSYNLKAVYSDEAIKKVVLLAGPQISRELKAQYRQLRKGGGIDFHDGAAMVMADRASQEILRKNLDAAAKKIYGDSPSGLHEVTVTGSQQLGHLNVEVRVTSNPKILAELAKMELRDAATVRHSDEDPSYTLTIDISDWDEPEPELKHYGVKGMKWGVRRQFNRATDPQTRTDIIRSVDKDWLDRVNTNAEIEKVTNLAEPQITSDSRAVMQRAKDSGVRSDDPEAIAKLNRELMGVSRLALDVAARKVYGTSPTGMYRPTVKLDLETGVMTMKAVVNVTARNVALINKWDDKDHKVAERQLKHSDEVPSYSLEIDLGITLESAELKHYGVKGMKWGVRRELKKSGSAAEMSEAVDRIDSKWLKTLQDDPKGAKIQRRVNKAVKADIKVEIARLKDVGLRKGSKEFRAQLDRFVQDNTLTRHTTELNKTYGVSPSGLRTPTLKFDPNTQKYSATYQYRVNPKLTRQTNHIVKSINKRNEREAAKSAEVKHSDLDGTAEFSGTFEFAINDDYEMVDWAETYDEITHGELMHHGVKGMKWGVRRTDAQLARASGESQPKSPVRTGNIQDNVESSTARYSRLDSEARSGKASSFTEADLKFYNGRSEALSKVRKMHETKPGWLSSKSKEILLRTVEKQMSSVADAVANKYIGGPIVSAIQNAPMSSARKNPNPTIVPKLLPLASRRSDSEDD